MASVIDAYFCRTGREFGRVIVPQPNDVDTHLELAAALLDQDKVQEACDHLRQALLLDQARADVFVMVGRSLLAKNLFVQAELSLRRAFELDPKSSETQAYLGRVLIHLGKSKEALELYLEAVKGDPANVRVMIGLGEAYMALGQFEAAARCFAEGIKREPTIGGAYLRLALCQTADDAAQGIALAETALGKPELTEQARVSVLFASGKWLDERARYEEAFARFAEANALSQKFANSKGIVYDDAAMARTVDETIETFSPAFFETRAYRGNASPAPVFIVGHYRSGTTLAEQIISSHPQARGAGELLAMRKISATLMPTPRTALTWSEADLAACANLYLDQLKQTAGDHLRIVDKHPYNILSVGLIAVLFPNASVIICTRDGRDTTLSNYFQKFTHILPHTNDLIDSARHFLQIERLSAHWKTVRPLKLMELNYETLVGDIEGEGRRLIEFIGLDWAPECLAFHATDRSVNTFSTWQVRQPVFTTSVGRWRNYEPYISKMLELFPPSPVNSDK